MILVLSPHLDDALLSVGAWLSWHVGVHVVTLFAGDPDEDLPLTGWDGACGFASGRHAMEVRRHEDRRACRTIGATVQHLPLLDGQYRNEVPYEGVLEETIDAIVEELHPDLVLAPIGLVHSDHVAVGNACDEVLELRPGLQVVRYEELPYRVDDPIAVCAAMGRGPDDLAWFWPEPCPDDEEAVRRKALAVACYTSQLWAVPRWALYVPERMWLCVE